MAGVVSVALFAFVDLLLGKHDLDRACWSATAGGDGVGTLRGAPPQSSAAPRPAARPDDEARGRRRSRVGGGRSGPTCAPGRVGGHARRGRCTPRPSEASIVREEGVPVLGDLGDAVRVLDEVRADAVLVASASDTAARFLRDLAWAGRRDQHRGAGGAGVGRGGAQPTAGAAHPDSAADPDHGAAYPRAPRFVRPYSRPGGGSRSAARVPGHADARAGRGDPHDELRPRPVPPPPHRQVRSRVRPAQVPAAWRWTRTRASTRSWTSTRATRSSSRCGATPASRRSDALSGGGRSTELPQLLNVLKGDMFPGRPAADVAREVEMYGPACTDGCSSNPASPAWAGEPAGPTSGGRTVGLDVPRIRRELVLGLDLAILGGRSGR